MQGQFWIIQTLNSVAFGGLLFLLSSGFSLIFGLMRIPNLAHGAFFMLGAYLGYSLLVRGVNFWIAALLAGLGVGLLGAALERFIIHPNNRVLLAVGRFLNGVIFRPLRIAAFDAFWRGLVARFRGLAGNEQGQVLMTLGVSFIIADICLLVWTGDPMPLPAPQELRRPLLFAGYAFPTYRLVVLGIALLTAVGLYLLMERTRLGAMIRAGVDDREMARGVGIPVSRLFTTVFLLGAALAGIGGVLGGPILNAYPGLDADMLPLALIVVILGGAGSLLGSFIGSFVVGFLYNFGIALAPDLAYFVLFLPMVLVLVFLPQGLFGRVQI
ncbi:MAG TPA: branched-chain amino acid ABC transporter permease [Xanthobacteraceae bacterium]|nr:branched-chain amino acid ABC transporter permease [Xanthobacteraceae bacterium]